MIVRVHAGKHPLRMVLADRMRCDAKSDRARDLHLVEQPIAQRLLVKGDVITTPDRGNQQIGLRRYDLGNVSGEVGGAKFRPAFRDDFGPGHQPFECEGEVLGSIAPITVVRMDMGDLADVWPGLCHADGSRDPVRRLNVGDAEHVFRIGIRLVEQEVGAPVRQNGQHRELLSHRA